MFSDISIEMRLIPFIIMGLVIAIISNFQRRKEKDAVKRKFISFKFSTLVYGIFLLVSLLLIPVTLPDKRDISVIEQRLNGDEHQRQAELNRQQINRDAVHDLKALSFFFLLMTGSWSVSIYSLLKVLVSVRDENLP